MANHSEAVQFTNPFASTRRPPPPAYQDHQHHHQQQQQQQQHQQHQQQHQPQSYQGHRSLYQPSSHSSRSSPQFRQPAPITPLMAVAPSDSIRPITSASFSERTYLLPSSPMNRGGNSGRRTPVNQVCRPKVLRTNGQRPAALVNASVTYCGDGQIYAFGGFDQFTDEVYNHVLRLDLESLNWTLVDNYGEIPGVRMGHTACLWQSDKLLVYGGENEHREHLSDVVIFDIKTATWSAPQVLGQIPRGRARHAAIVHDDKLFICGGVASMEQHVLSDISYLDLKTWTWSRSWRFVPRFDHVARVWGDRLWVFGGLGPDTERNGEIWWLDLRNSPAFQTTSDSMDDVIMDSRSASGSRTASRVSNHPHTNSTSVSSTHIANSRTTASRTPAALQPIAPGAIGSMQFHAGSQVPSHTIGTHFYSYSSGAIIDFVTPIGSARPVDCSISSFELGTLQWQKLADGKEVFDLTYRWQYCAINEEGTKAWLLGCPNETQDGNGASSEEFLSDVLALDLTKYGLAGEDPKKQQKFNSSKIPPSDTCGSSDLIGPAVDFANMFDKALESGTLSDFQITALRDDYDSDDAGFETSENPEAISQPINVHKLILLARWPHFSRAYAAQMSEFHSKKMHIPEPYSVVRAFLWYLYTDSIDKHTEFCPSLREVAGMMVMANVYNMPRLRALCVHRLSREMDVESAATIWERAGVASDDWLSRRAASFCMTHWGRVVRTQAFRNLPQQSMVELCENIDLEGRVVPGDELEQWETGSRLGISGRGGSSISRRRVSTAATISDTLNEGETEDEEAMEVS